jgi:hypothetical protein
MDEERERMEELPRFKDAQSEGGEEGGERIKLLAV